MTESDLIARLAQRHPQLVVKAAEYSLRVILDSMKESLLVRRRIEIRGFGSFGLAVNGGRGRRERRRL